MQIRGVKQAFFFQQSYINVTTRVRENWISNKVGNGGDLIYRWGNDNAYSKEQNHKQKLFSQQDPYWIPEGLPDGGKVFVFNYQV